MDKPKPKPEIRDDVLTINKYLDKSGDYVILDIKICKNLQRLLKKFAVFDDTEPINNTNSDRYLIKRVLTNAIIWRRDFYFLFAVSLIEKGKAKIKVTSTETANCVLNNFNTLNLTNLIKEMVKMQKKVLLKVEIKTEIEVQKWAVK